MSHKSDLFELINDKPDKWQQIFHDEVRVIDHQFDLNAMDENEVKLVARMIYLRTESRFTANIVPEKVDEVLDIAKLIMGAPKHWLTSLKTSILNEHPEMAYGDFIQPPLSQ